MSNLLRRKSQKFARLAKKYGLATGEERALAPLRYDWELIKRDVIALLNRRRALPTGSRAVAKDREKGVRKTYPENLVNHLAGEYLACCNIEQRPPSQELVALIAQQLKTANFRVKGGKDDKLRRAQGIRYFKPGMSNRQLAEHVGVDTPTIGRWVKDGLLLKPNDAPDPWPRESIDGELQENK